MASKVYNMSYTDLSHKIASYNARKLTAQAAHAHTGWQRAQALNLWTVAGILRRRKHRLLGAARLASTTARG